MLSGFSHACKNVSCFLSFEATGEKRSEDVKNSSIVSLLHALLVFFFLIKTSHARKKKKNETDHDKILERKKWNGAVSCRFLFSWSFSGRNGCLAKSASICVQLRKRNLHSNVLICNEGKQE